MDNTESSIPDHISCTMANQTQTSTDVSQLDNQCKPTSTQLEKQDRLQDINISNQNDRAMDSMMSKDNLENEQEYKDRLSGSEVKPGCDELNMGGQVDDYPHIPSHSETEDVFYATQMKDTMITGNMVSPPSRLSEMIAPVTSNQNPTDCGGCAGNFDNSNIHNNNNNIDNNMTNNNNNLDSSKTQRYSSTGEDAPKDRPINKILTSLFSSTSSKPQLPRSLVHRTASSLSSISEEEMLTMMDSMGEDEILSALPPCDCDECLLNEPRSPTTVPPDQRKLTRTSSWRKIRSFILWSPFIQVFKKHRYPWIQLAGHQGNFHAGEAGSVLKKLDQREQKCFQRLMADPLKEFVPEYRGNVEKNGEMYIQLQDLLASFSQPCVMDVKMGVRTYLEAELEKARKSPTLRKDMYQKMVEVDNTAPTQAEHEQRAVTKPRYMQWRDQMSSSTELGFRVEGIKKTDGSSTKDFKKTKSRGNIVDIIVSFVANNETIAAKYVKRLKEIMAVQETSAFFRAHEVVGSSLLFVHDAEENVGVWMIDFGKTEQLSGDKTLDHRSEWQEGNREDGYLFGLDNMISIFEEVHTNLSSSSV